MSTRCDRRYEASPTPPPPAARRWAPARLPVFLLVLALVGCDSVFSSPDWSVQIGTLAEGPESAAIQVPDSAVAGVPFTVSVRTRGGGCDRRGPTRVERLSGRRTVVPTDSIFVGAALCPAVLRSFLHEATVEFGEVGEATVRLRVRDPADGSVIELDRSVAVGTPAAGSGVRASE